MEVQETPGIEAIYIDENKGANKKINNKNDNDMQTEVICPECNENCFININNYKINLFDCKNAHNINNILYENYENMQVTTQKKLCENCKKKKKSFINVYHVKLLYVKIVI